MTSPDIKTVRAAGADRPPSPHLADHHWAWFLDVDGTLLEIEEHPDLVSADPRLKDLLRQLGEVYDGAVALISGRSLDQLDAIFGPNGIAVAASHGLELRPAKGTVTCLAGAIPVRKAERIAAFVGEHPGLVLERKPFSIGVHFRARPDLAEEVRDTLEKVTAELDGEFKLQHGKMVVELLPLAADKGRAIHAFLAMPPFRGRRPVFVGDDVTDEQGFAVVNELGGLSVRVGHTGETAAKCRLENVSELRVWLRSAVSLV
jgi:trehalose 6-phosphate phosphatase